MDLRDEDWNRLSELRSRFLSPEDPATPGTQPDYWSNRRDLELYDATFAQRIGWKWRAVLREIERRDARPTPGLVLDWGSGTGIAARTWLAAFGAGSAERVRVFDRSRAAQEYAVEKLHEEHPEVDVSSGTPEPHPAPDVLLVSHVLNELGDVDLDLLLALARASRFVVWVETGNRATSRRLSQLRDALLATSDGFEVVAPCTHQARCGMLDLAHERDWCHHFATPPPEAFTSRHWTFFAKRLRIDLRALPYAFLVLRKSASAPRETARGRVLGRPRMGKGHVLVDWCDHAGVSELRLLERTAPKLVREWRKSIVEMPIFRAEIEGTRIVAIERGIDPGPGD